MPFSLSFVLCIALGIPVESSGAGLAPSPCEQAGSSRYYFTLFAGQSVPFRHRTAHTWGTYTKVTPTSDGGQLVELVTISWLPVSGTVRPHALRPEPGKNYSLEETLALMASHNSQVSRWGPYEVDAHRYELAQKQVAFLNSGAARYRAIDSFNMNDDVVNCVHALTHAGPSVRHHVQPVMRVGEPGTSRLAKLYVRGGAFPGYPETHDWIIPAIGADQYPIHARQPGERIPRRVR